MSSRARKLDFDPWPALPKVHGGPAREVRRAVSRRTIHVPELSREGLQWRTQGRNVEIVVDVANTGSEPTRSDTLVIEAAPLGAFVPGYEIARVPVLAIDPGGHRRVPVTVARALLPAAHSFDEWVTAARVLLSTARARSSDEWLKVLFDRLEAVRQLDPIIPTDWVGNLNVWFDAAPERAVEAHRALDLKVTAGRRAAIWLFLPPAATGYDFAIGTEGGWTAVVERSGGAATLVVEAPPAARRAAIDLLVTRRSDGHAVPVEFTFESVEGPGGHLGCVRL